MIKKLSEAQINSVSGAGKWDDFWFSVGAWFADSMYDHAFTEHNAQTHSAGKSGDDAKIRAEFPNDPLL